MILDREYAYTRAALRRRIHLGMTQQPEGIRGAPREPFLAGLVWPPMARDPHSDTRSGSRLYLGTRLERGLTALLVFRVQPEDPSIGGAHGDGVMPERARGGPGRGIAVPGGGVAHHVLERDLIAPLALEIVDAVDRDERAGHVACDGVENLELLTEALRTGRPLHIQDADDRVASTERHDHGLSGLRIAAAEAVVIDRTQEDDPLAPAGHPSGDSLVDPLLVPERHADPDRGAHPEAVALDEHDRRPAGADSRRDVFRRACQKGRRVARLLEPGEEVLEEGHSVVVLRALMFRVGHCATVVHAHPEKLRRGARGGQLDRVERDAVP